MYQPEHEAFRGSIRAFIDRDVRPLVSRLTTTGPAPQKIFDVAGAHGFLGICAPEEHGGAGIGDLRFPLLAAAELTAAGFTGVALAYAMHAAVAVTLLAGCLPPGQRERWLPKLASGDVLATMTSEVRLAASSEGLVLDGTTDVMVNATGAGLLIVPVLIVPGHTDRADRCLVIVPVDAPGLTRVPVDDALGVPGADLGTAEFRAVAVDDDAVLRVGGTSEVARARADEQLALATIALAGARAALTMTLDYVRERKAFGQPIASFQNTRYALAGIHADLIIAESFLAACASDRGSGCLSPQHAAAARLRCAELFTATADQCLQLHGGYGYMREYPISQAFADARYLHMHAGGSAAVKETLAAGLGLPAVKGAGRASATGGGSAVSEAR